VTDVALPDALASVRNHIANELRGDVVVWSGELDDEAGVDRLVAAMHVLVTYLRPDVQLVVLASHGDQDLFDRIVRFTIELGVKAWCELDPADGVLDLVVERADLHLGDLPDVSPELLAEWIESQLP
jgi:hypothetical protein